VIGEMFNNAADSIAQGSPAIGGTVILSQQTGSPGLAGTYTVNNSQFAASQTLQTLALGFNYKQIAGSPPVTTPTTLGVWGVDGFALVQNYPSWNAAGTCTNVIVQNQVANIALASGHAAPQMGPTTITGNFFDVSSQAGTINGTIPTNQQIWTIGDESAPITGWTGHITGNTLTIDTGTPALSVSTYIAGAGIDNCGTAMSGTCPYIVSVSPAVTVTNAVWSSAGIGQVTFTTASASTVTVGASFTVTGIANSPTSPNLFNNTYVAIAGTSGTTVVGQLQSGATLGNAGTYASGGSMTPLVYTLSNSNVSPVSAEAMSAHFPTICSAPAVFANNSDMTGVLNAASYEGWTDGTLASPPTDVYGCF
jgi:hypothetical protein